MSYDAVEKVYAIRSKELTRSEKSILLYLAHRSNFKYECWPSTERIARDTGFRRQRVSVLIQSLKEKKFIFITSSLGKCNRYTVNAIKIDNLLPKSFVNVPVDKSNEPVRESDNTCLIGRQVPVLESDTNHNTNDQLTNNSVVGKLKAFGLPEPRIKKWISSYGIESLEIAIAVRSQQKNPIENELGWFSICLKNKWQPIIAQFSNKSSTEKEQPHTTPSIAETEKYIRNQESNKPVRNRTTEEYREYFNSMMNSMRINHSIKGEIYENHI